MENGKAAICIDNGYFAHICKHHDALRIRFKKFVDMIAKKSGIGEYTPYIYDCMPYQSRKPTPKERERYAGKDKFFSALRKDGFIIRLGKLQKIGNIFTQKKVDTLWTADICKLSYTRAVDTIIVISGDSDFVPGIEIAKENGVHTILWYDETENTGTSFDLIKTCDEVHKISKKLLDSCKLN